MSEPRRLHPAAIVILAIKSVYHLSKSALIPFGAWLVSQVSRHGLTGRHLWLALLGILVLFGLSVGWGILHWRRFTYRVEGGELRIEHGVIRRQKRYIPRERIQSIDFEEGILHRALGIVKVRIETAGGAQQEAALAAVSRRDARQLRQELLVERTAPAGGNVPADAATSTSRPVLVYHLSWMMLLVAGATSGSFALLLPFVGGLYSLLDELQLTDKVFETISSRVQVSATASFVVAVVFVVLLVAWLASILLTVFTYADFRLKLEGDSLLIQRGLISRRHSTIPQSRIQAIRIVEGLLRQPFGLVSIHVESAGYRKQETEATALCPLLPRKDVPALLRTIAPEFGDALGPDGTALHLFRNDGAGLCGQPRADDSLHRLPSRARRRYIVRACIPSVLLVGAVWVFAWYFGLLPLGLSSLLLVALAGLIGDWRYRDAGWYRTGDTLVFRARRLARTVAIVTRRRIQMCSVSQSIFQRRKDLATFAVRVASGHTGATFLIKDIEFSDGQRLYSWVGGRQNN